MQKSGKSAASRPPFLFSKKGSACLILGLVIAVASFWCDSLFRLDLIHAATAVKTSDIPPHAVPVSPGAQERWTVLPAMSADARWWIIHSTEMIREGSFRVRHTDRDNAPDGREVHWSSLLMWVVMVLSGVIGSITGKGVLDTVPEAAFYACPVLFAAAIAGLCLMIGRRFGVRFAIFFAIAFSTSVLIYGSFRLAECDHHGIVQSFASGSVLAICCGGVGFVFPSGRRQTINPGQKELFPTLANARIWFALSGMLGGAALWVSAATVIPIFVGCGIGALAAAWIGRGGEEKGPLIHPELWRIWGIAGCCSSLFFYLLEYFPDHLGWRLEVNHPLYALALLGSGEILYRTTSGLAGKKWIPKNQKEWAGFLLAIAFVLIPPALAVIRKEYFFWVSDKFLLSLHVEYIQEFHSLWKSLHWPGAVIVLLDNFLWPAFVAFGIILLVVFCKIPRRTFVLLFFPLFPAAVMQGLALLQVRWGLIVMGLWLVCAVMVTVVYSSGDYPGRIPTPFRWVLMLTAFLAVTLFPLRVLPAFLGRGDLARNIPKDMAPTIILRDVAHQLIQANPDHLPVVLAGVDSSTDLTYYGGIRTLGTLYWENLPGLERAARIFAAPTGDEAKQLILRAGVTHIVIASWDDFGEAYVRLLKKSGKIPKSDGKTFLAGLIEGKECPDWLRPLFYPVPQAFGLEDQKVKIFAVMPDQSPQEALINRGIYFLDAGDDDRAREILKQAQQNSPSDPRISALLSTAEARKGDKSGH
jgi:hypothetical protein